VGYTYRSVKQHTLGSEGKRMSKVLIVVDQPALAGRVADLVLALLVQREWEMYLLHVVPFPFVEASGWASTVVLEGYVTADRCDAIVAPLLDHLGHAQGTLIPSEQRVPRLVPRHLVHDHNLGAQIGRCRLAQQRQDSINLLEAYAQQLGNWGVPGSRVTRDSAIGAVATIVAETAAHIAADLVIMGERVAGRVAYGTHPSGAEATTLRLAAPVLIVPLAVGEARSGAHDVPVRP
jgi:nucleotide-binding universal stress UspA family protein